MTVTLCDFCESLIAYGDGHVEDALREYFRLLGQRDFAACCIAGGYGSERIEAEVVRAAEVYRRGAAQAGLLQRPGPVFHS